MKTIATQLVADITTDTGWPLYIIRLLHNKFIYGAFYGTQCYLLYVDASQLVRFLSPFFIPFVIAAFLGRKKRRLRIALVALMPLFFIFNPLHLTLQQRILSYQIFFMILAILGCALLIKKTVRR